MSSKQFQEKWVTFLREGYDFDTSVEQLQRFVDEGADVNAYLGIHGSWWEEDTPLYHLMYNVYGERDSRLTFDQCEHLIQFLLLNGAVPSEFDIQRALFVSHNPKIFEQFLYFAKEEDIRFYEYRDSSPLFLEIILGFPSVSLDQETSYNFTCFGEKVRGRQVRVGERNFNCLPIERYLLDYATQLGNEMEEKIRILKKYGTPMPRKDILNEILFLINKEEVWERFREIYSKYF